MTGEISTCFDGVRPNGYARSMSEMENLTLEVLKDIRGELGGLRGEVRELRGEVQKTNQRLDETVERLDRLETRPTESETRLARELVAVADAIHLLKTEVLEQLNVKKQVDNHEVRLIRLEERA